MFIKFSPINCCKFIANSVIYKAWYYYLKTPGGWTQQKKLDKKRCVATQFCSAGDNTNSTIYWRVAKCRKKLLSNAFVPVEYVSCSIQSALTNVQLRARAAAASFVLNRRQCWRFVKNVSHTFEINANIVPFVFINKPTSVKPYRMHNLFSPRKDVHAHTFSGYFISFLMCFSPMAMFFRRIIWNIVWCI